MQAALSLPLDVELTSIPDLLRVALRPLVEQAKRSRIDLHLATLGQVPDAAVDREKIAWAVTALAGSALRYEVDREVGGSVVVHVTHDSATNSVCVAVQDDGPGIPDDTVPFLFERRRGALVADGLALTLVRQIVAAHGGRIEVESRRASDDHGTSITLALPASR